MTIKRESQAGLHKKMSLNEVLFEIRRFEAI